MALENRIIFKNNYSYLKIISMPTEKEKGSVKEMGFIRDTNVIHTCFFYVYPCSRTNVVQPLEIKRFQSATNLEQTKPPLSLLDVLGREAFGIDTVSFYDKVSTYTRENNLQVA